MLFKPKDEFLTDINGTPVYNLTQNTWLVSHLNKELKKQVLDTYRTNKLYKLVCLPSYTIYLNGMMSLFNCTKKTEHMFYVMEKIINSKYNDDLKNGMIFAYLHKSMEKTIDKFVFSKEFETYNKDCLCYTLLFAGNEIDLFPYLKEGKSAEEIFNIGQKMFYDRYIKKAKKPNIKKYTHTIGMHYTGDEIVWNVNTALSLYKFSPISKNNAVCNLGYGVLRDLYALRFLPVEHLRFARQKRMYGMVDPRIYRIEDCY